MKLFPGIRRSLTLVLALACTLMIFSCETRERDTTASREMTSDMMTGNVTIEEARILIPGTKISDADQEAMNNVLSQYRMSLYKVETYENGKLTKTRGVLSDQIISEATVAQVRENAKRNHLSGSAIQVGFDVSGSAPATGTGIGTHHHAGATTIGGTRHHTTPTPRPGGDPGDSGPGFDVGGTRHASPTPGYNVGSRHHLTAESEAIGSRHRILSARDYAEAEALVKRLKPILQKYSKQ